MNSGPAYFEIEADDPQRAIHFYSELFGWTFTKGTALPVPYWRIETGGIMGGLLNRPAPAPSAPCGTNAFVCSMEVKDFDTTQKKILELGGTVAMPKFLIPGRCWQGYFVDPEGNTFGIFEVDANAG